MSHLELSEEETKLLERLRQPKASPPGVRRTFRMVFPWSTLAVALVLDRVFRLGVKASHLAAYAVGVALIIFWVYRRRTSLNHPVIRAIFDDPERVRTIELLQTRSHSPAYYVRVSTDAGSLCLHASADWEELMTAITRRCPNAKTSGLEIPIVPTEVDSPAWRVVRYVNYAAALGAVVFVLSTTGWFRSVSVSDWSFLGLGVLGVLVIWLCVSVLRALARR